MTPAEQLAVPCPREWCDAEAGETCEHEHATDGRRPRSPHPERLVAARERLVAMDAPPNIESGWCSFGSGDAVRHRRVGRFVLVAVSYVDDGHFDCWLETDGGHQCVAVLGRLRVTPGITMRDAEAYCEGRAREAGVAVPEAPPPFTADERAANQAAADGLPPRAIAVVRRILAAGGKARRVGAHESTADQTAVCHITHALAHLGDAGDDSLDGIDRDSGELSLAHAAARLLLALEVVLAGKAGR